MVGYDTRFLSERFAESAADVLNSHGVEAHVTSRPHPTPALAYDIIHRKLDGGINITASHNPAEYNGLEFSSADGAPALPEVTHEIEENVGRILEDPSLLEGSNATRLDPSLRQQADPRPAYLDEIRRRVDLKEIARAKLKIAYDPLYGTARGYLDQLLTDAGANVEVIHDFRDVLFSGVGPEPTERILPSSPDSPGRRAAPWAFQRMATLTASESWTATAAGSILIMFSPFWLIT